MIRDGILNPGVIFKQRIKSEENCLKGYKILDVGCGAGILSEALAELGAEVVGLEPAEALVEVAKKHSSRRNDLNIKYSTELVQDHAEKYKDHYDVVVLSEVIEHVTNQEFLVESCVKSLKPGGLIFISTVKKSWWSWIVAILFGEYILGFLPIGTHDWNQFINPEVVSVYLEKNNCKTLQCQGFWFDVFRHKCVYRELFTTAYMLHAVKRGEK
jgi:ubiquinone biosynthesis O-methyltransferase